MYLLEGSGSLQICVSLDSSVDVEYEIDWFLLLLWLTRFQMSGTKRARWLEDVSYEADLRHRSPLVDEVVLAY